MELYALYDDERDDRTGQPRVRIGVGGELSRRLDQTEAKHGRPLKLAFRALFKETAVARDWERKLRHRLQDSGAPDGQEWFFVTDEVLAALCEAAKNADEHEWIIPLANDELFERVEQLRDARLAVKEAFNEWVSYARTGNAELKIRSHIDFIDKSLKRVVELERQYTKSHFFNDGEDRNAHTDYTISKIKDAVGQRRNELAQLRGEVNRGEDAYMKWQESVRHVNRLEQSLAFDNREDG